jgi:diguanylate cyclase (GGDEF)-like protein
MVAGQQKTSSHGLLSNQSLKELLTREIARSNRYNSSLCVAFIDIDGLSQWNEKHGYATGDALLQALGESFRYGLRDADVIARVGDDEFFILLQRSDLNGAAKAIERCRQLFWAVPLGVPDKTRGTFSAGISQLAAHEKDGRLLLERAVQGLLSAKQNGGDTLFCQPTPRLEQPC